LVFGVQVAIWIVTGLYFALTPIAQVRGEHLRDDRPPGLALSAPLVAPEMAAAAVGGTPSVITLRSRGDAPIYLVELADGTRHAVDARSGQIAAPMTPVQAEAIARSVYRGTGAVTAVTYAAVPPREYTRHGPVFGVQFGPADGATLYVDALSGDARVVRTEGWRVYDILWGLHIMDWVDRENFNSLHLAIFAVGASVLTALGLLLAVLRVGRRRS
jgi:hypothetical protein